MFLFESAAVAHETQVRMEIKDIERNFVALGVFIDTTLYIYV